MMNNPRRQIHPVESKKRKETTNSASAEPTTASAGSPQILAGYMAYEFLTRGTLLGQKFDPARAEAVAVTPAAKRGKHAAEQMMGGDQKRKSYAEVASLLKTEGVHIPWVVNPTQLARWVQM